jgi:hypothetical protein
MNTLTAQSRLELFALETGHLHQSMSLHGVLEHSTLDPVLTILGAQRAGWWAARERRPTTNVQG